MCLITDIAIAGHGISAGGRPTSYVVTATVDDCKAVNITVRVEHETGQDLGAPSNVPIDDTGEVRADFATLATHDVRCDQLIWVRIECVDDEDCAAEEIVVLDCPDPQAPPVRSLRSIPTPMPPSRRKRSIWACPGCLPSRASPCQTRCADRSGSCSRCFWRCCSHA